MRRRIMCALISAAMLTASVMAGCSEGSSVSVAGSSVPDSVADTEQPTQKENSVADTEQPSQKEKSEIPEETKPVIPGVLAPMQAKKIGKVSIDADSIDVYRAGIVYTDSEGKCGVLSLDGKKDTGAKYAKLSSSTLYNDVYMTTVKALTADEQNVNVYGAVAKNGEEAVPCQYAKVEALSERYVKVYTAEEKTDNKDEAVVYFSKNEFSFEPKDGDEMYSGKWEVYDVDKKAFVKGASGTNREDYAIAYGQFLEVRYKASGEKKTFDGNGDSVTDGRKIFSNGSYVLEINGKCAVYDTNDTRLFNFDEKTYRIYDYKEPYFIGKVGSGGYVLINDKGEKVSSEFKGLFSQVFPDFVRSEDTVYRLDGTKLFEEKYDMLNFDSVNRDAYNAYNVTEKTEVVFDKTGEVLFSGNKDTDDFGGMTFKFYKNNSAKMLYYNYKEKDFNIEADYNGEENWLLSVKSGKLCDLIDLRTGTKVLQNSYSTYKFKNDDLNHITYVYAINSINGKVNYGDFDIYTVSA